MSLPSHEPYTRRMLAMMKGCRWYLMGRGAWGVGRGAWGVGRGAWGVGLGREGLGVRG
jgi:hypothetical protein